MEARRLAPTRPTFADTLLEHPLAYRALHSLTGLRRLHARLIAGVMPRFAGRAQLRVLDLGCGPGDTLKLIDRRASYTGIDTNAKYIDLARKKAPASASFLVGDVTRLDPARFEPFDLIIAFGLLHHLDDGAVDALLEAVSRMLAAGGVLATLDGCRRDDNPRVVTWMLDHDRGRFVRREPEYLALVSRHLQLEAVASDASAMHIPYATIAVTATKKPECR